MSEKKGKPSDGGIFSVPLERQARRSGLTVEQMAMADLVAAGWGPKDAWMMTVREGLTWPRDELFRAIDGLCGTQAFKERQQKVKEALTAAQIEKFAAERENVKKRDVKKKTSKDSLLADLLAARENVNPGTLDYAKITMQIADLTNAKKEEVVKEDTTIHFHLPAKCSFCGLYAEFRKKQEESGDTEDTGS